MPNIAVLRRCYFLLSIVLMASALSVLGSRIATLKFSKTMSEDQNYERHIQELRESVFMPPDMTLKFCNVSKGDWVSVKERIFWVYLDEELIDKHFRLYPDDGKAEYVRQLRSKHRLPQKPIEKEESEKLWLFGRIFDSDLLDEDEIRNIREGARLRAEASRPRIMAYLKSKSIDVGPSNSSPATASQEHTNPNQYQTSHGDAEADGGGGGQFLHYQQPTDIVGEPLNSSPR